MKTSHFILSVWINLLLSVPVFSQESNDSIVPYNYSKSFYYPAIPKPWTIVETMPKFPGGEDKLLKFISDNMKYASDSRKSDQIRSRVYLNFVVDTSGNVINKCIQRPFYDNHLTGFEKAMLMALDKMPKWTPGEQDGQKVFVKFEIPMTIELR